MLKWTFTSILKHKDVWAGQSLLGLDHVFDNATSHRFQWKLDSAFNP